MYYFKTKLAAHGCCSNVNINSDNHNSDSNEDYTCAFSNLLKSNNFRIFCIQHHPSYKYRKVTDIFQKKSILSKNGCCLLCLES